MRKPGGFHALFRSLHLRLLMVLVLLATPLAAAVENWTPWTTIGSAGTVDQADQDIAVFSGSWAGVSASAALPATVNVRYNIVSVDGLIQGGGRHYMKVRYLDNGDQARVVVYLKELDLTTGVTTTRMTFDSNSYPQSFLGQSQTMNVGCTFPFPPAPWGYNFEEKAYYLETQLIKTGSSGSAWVDSIQLRDEYCVG
jgi:hypothetical protein